MGQDNSFPSQSENTENIDSKIKKLNFGKDNLSPKREPEIEHLKPSPRNQNSNQTSPRQFGILSPRTPGRKASAGSNSELDKSPPISPKQPEEVIYTPPKEYNDRQTVLFLVRKDGMNLKFA